MDNGREFILYKLTEQAWIKATPSPWATTKFKNQAKVFTLEQANNMIKSGKSLGFVLDKYLVSVGYGSGISSNIDEDPFDNMDQYLKVYDSEHLGFYIGIKLALDRLEFDSKYIRRSDYYDTRHEAQKHLDNKTYSRTN